MRQEINLKTGGITNHEDAPAPPAPTAQEIENEKSQQAEDMMASPLGSAMMEEFIQILNDNNLNVPPTAAENIKSRIRSKL